MAVLVLIWGTTWAAIRIGLRGVPPFTGAAVRFAGSALVLLALHPFFRLRFDARPAVRRLWLLNGLLVFFVSYGTVYVTERWLPSGLAAILFATYPLMVALLSVFLLPGERATRSTWLGAAIGLAGVIVIQSEDLAALAGKQARAAAAIFLLSPLTTSIANVLTKRWGEGVHPLSLTAVPMGIGAVLLGATAALLERGVSVRWDVTSIACVAYLALLGSVVAFGLFYWLLARLPATKVALIVYGTPVVAVLTGTLFLAEPFTPRIAVGAATVLVGVAIATRKR